MKKIAIISAITGIILSLLVVFIHKNIFSFDSFVPVVGCMYKELGSTQKKLSNSEIENFNLKQSAVRLAQNTKYQKGNMRFTSYYDNDESTRDIHYPDMFKSQPELYTNWNNTPAEKTNRQILWLRDSKQIPNSIEKVLVSIDITLYQGNLSVEILSNGAIPCSTPVLVAQQYVREMMDEVYLPSAANDFIISNTTWNIIREPLLNF